MRTRLEFQMVVSCWEIYTVNEANTRHQDQLPYKVFVLIRVKL